MELLILSLEGLSQLLRWPLSIREDGMDASVMNDWT